MRRRCSRRSPRNLGALQPIERFGLVSDTWAATVAGLAPLSEFLKMARLFTDETDINVWRALIGAFSYLDMIASDADRPALAADGARGRRSRGRTAGMGAKVRRERARCASCAARSSARSARSATIPRCTNARAISMRACEDNPQSADRDLMPGAGEHPGALRRRRALRGVQAKVQIAAHAAGRAALPVRARKFPRSRSPAEKPWR